MQQPAWEDLSETYLPHPLLSQIPLSLQTGSRSTGGSAVSIDPGKGFCVVARSVCLVCYHTYRGLGRLVGITVLDSLVSVISNPISGVLAMRGKIVSM